MLELRSKSVVNSNNDLQISNSTTCQTSKRIEYCVASEGPSARVDIKQRPTKRTAQQDTRNAVADASQWYTQRLTMLVGWVPRSVTTVLQILSREAAL